jgi:hypothetical protein
VFGPERKRSHGRPRYRLVDEKLALELDISSTYCIPVKARALRKSNDADKEEWDVIDDGQLPSSSTAVRLLSSGYEGSKSSTLKPVSSSTFLLKPPPSHLAHSPLRKAPPTKAPRFHVVLSPTKTKKPKKVGKISQHPKRHAKSSVNSPHFTKKRAPEEVAPDVTTPSNHAHDPFKRTRSSPIFSADVATVSVEERDSSPASQKERKRRRCMRCVENGGSIAQATVCAGSKGRFGREFCEFFDPEGHKVKEFDEPRSPVRTTPSGRKPRRCLKCVENGRTEIESMDCPGAQGRHGQKGCIYFPQHDEQHRAEEGTESGKEDEFRTVVFSEESRVEVMLDTTNRKRKRGLVEESDRLDGEAHPRKSLRTTSSVSYAE